MGKSNSGALEFCPPDVSKTSHPELARTALAMVEEIIPMRNWQDADPTKTVNGAKLLVPSKPEAHKALRVLLELLMLYKHERARIYKQAYSEVEADKPSALWNGYQRAGQTSECLGIAVDRLCKRNLDLPDDLLDLLARCSLRDVHQYGWFVAPKVVVRQVQFALKARESTDALCESLRRMVAATDNSFGGHDKELAQLNLVIEQHHGTASTSIPVPPKSIPVPTNMAGHPGVLAGLKKRLGFPYPDNDDVATEIIGADKFPLRSDSPLADEHRLLSPLLEARGLNDHWETASFRATIEAELGRHADEDERTALKAASKRAKEHASRAEKEYAKQSKRIKSLPPAKLGRLLLAAIERRVQKHDVDDDREFAIARVADPDGVFEHPQEAIVRTKEAARELANEFVELPGWTIEDIEVFDLLLVWATVVRDDFSSSLFEPLHRIKATRPLTTGEMYVLQRVAVLMLKHPPLSRPSQWNSEIGKLLGASVGYWLAPCEQWAQTLHNDVAAMKPEAQQAWHAAMVHALSATQSAPSAKWRKAADDCIKAVGAAAFRTATARWFADVAKGDSANMRQAMMDVSWYDPDEDSPIHDGNAIALRGLAWMLARAADPGTPQVVGSLLLESARNTPGTGPRSGKLANACIWTLGELAGGKDAAIRASALAQLARAKTRVKNKPILASINKAHDKAAKAAGVSRETLEESGMPAFGFVNGVRTQKLGDTSIELRVDRNKVVTQWTNAAGKVVKAPPAAAKRDHADTIKELKLAAKDAEGMLTAARARLDGLYLLDNSWTLSDWRERYLDHGLIGTIACRLIWLIDKTPVMQLNGKLVDIKGNPVTPAAKAAVRLWHPIGRSADEVLAWRSFVEDHEITQPFKQAHREVYLLTDAERTTATYSNRFAAHLIKQHQFSSLCAVRQWRHKLHMVYEGIYPPPSRNLPKWNLRAEFWVEGAGDSDPTSDGVNDSGTFTHLATDQVRFYPVDAAQVTTGGEGGGYDLPRSRDEAIPEPEPLRLDQIPPLVLSEIMRDVDLFVGVASVGNDPNWTDGRSDGALHQQYHGYWHSYSFGDLSATAGTRKQVLQRLIPRLKIADRCSFTDRFLVVKGDIRTYKIHLGSGNILMEPNDQYLCIVPKAASVDAADGKVFLPFEGDRTMSIILSKALLLADDTKIKDASIVSQIARR